MDPQTRPRSQDPNPQLAWQRLEPGRRSTSSRLYGPYPFESVGGVVDWAPNVFYSLESQTKPMYWRVPSEATVVHEIAHMWCGDAVTLGCWPDIWLNEGFATWSEWIFGAPRRRRGAETFDQLYATPEDGQAGQDLWFPAPAALPGPARCSTRPSTTAGR